MFNVKEPEEHYFDRFGNWDEGEDYSRKINASIWEIDMLRRDIGKTNYDVLTLVRVEIRREAISIFSKHNRQQRYFPLKTTSNSL